MRCQPSVQGRWAEIASWEEDVFEMQRSLTNTAPSQGVSVIEFTAAGQGRLPRDFEHHAPRGKHNMLQTPHCNDINLLTRIIRINKQTEPHNHQLALGYYHTKAHLNRFTMNQI